MVVAPFLLAAVLQGAAFDPATIDLSPNRCEPNPALTRLLALAGTGYGDLAVVQAVAGTTTRRVDFARALAWHGLRLRAVSATQGIESGPRVVTLHFTDAIAAAAPRLARYRLPPLARGEAVRQLDGPDDVVGARMSLAADGTGSALSCTFD